MAKPPKKPVAQLVSELGGPQSVATKLNTTDGAVRMWVFRKAIPRSVWPELIEAFPDVTLDKLRAIEERAA